MNFYFFDLEFEKKIKFNFAKIKNIIKKSFLFLFFNKF